jgi:multidrug efflux system membrane fusion protein
VAQLEAQVAQDQAQIDTARTNLSYTTITAPIAGRAGMRLLDQGNIAHASDTTGLVVITALQPIAVVFTLPQQTLPQVAAAMRAGEPEVVALGQASGLTGAAPELDRGRLAVLDNQVDPTTGTIKLKALFPNAARLLWPGGFANVRLRVDTRSGALVVPPAAIQRGPRGTFVYVISPESTVQRRAVTVEHEDQSVSVVTSGLNPGDRVVTDGAARLGENMKVTVTTVEEPRTGPAPAAPPGTRRRGARGG